MSVPTNDDIERLLRPIAGDAPAGASQRYEGVYDKIREARREDDASIPQGDWARPLKVADWNAVVSSATEALEMRSKDLQIAAWLADAWAQLHGVAGAKRGIELVAGLVERFWDGLYPLLDGDDDEPRARVLDWMDGALARRLRAAKLGDDRVSIVYGDWDRPVTMADAEGAPTRDGMIARMSLVGASRWAGLRDEIEAARQALRAMDQGFAARTGKASAARASDEVLAGMKGMVVEILATLGPKGAGPAEVAVGLEAPSVSSVRAAAAGGGGIGSRAEAYQRLVEAADYLLRTEPHSPVPYLVKRAVAWGNMPLTELLQEFITGADDLVTTHRLLGMRLREG